MSLAAAIEVHRDSILGDLDSVHDYFTNTKVAWRIIQRSVQRGAKFRIHNSPTGHVTTEEEVAGKAQFYVTDYLVVATFQHFVSLFEDFVFGLMRHWLLAYPQSLSSKQIKFATILEAQDLETLRLFAIDNELNEIAYRSVRDWFDYLDRLVKLGCPSGAEIERLTEIKATRDVHTHNRGIVSSRYLLKAGTLCRGASGERLAIPEHYHRESWQLIRKVVVDVSAAAIAKAGK